MFLLYMYLCISTQSIELTKSQTKAAWLQTYAAWGQFCIALVSVIVAIAWLFIHLYSRKLRWHLQYRMIKDSNDNNANLRIRIRNSSEKNANDTIIIKDPKYIVCSYMTYLDIGVLNEKYNHINNKFVRAFYMILNYKNHYNLTLYHKLLNKCYIDTLEYFPFINHDLKNIKNNAIHLQMESISKLSMISGSTFQLYGNRTNPSKILISKKTLSLVFKGEYKLYLKFIDNHIHLVRFLYNNESNIINVMEAHRPLYPLHLGVLAFKYRKRLLGHIDNKNSYYHKYLNLINIKHLEQKYAKTGNNKHPHDALFNDLVYMILIPCYDVKKHKVKVIELNEQYL